MDASTTTEAPPAATKSSTVDTTPAVETIKKKKKIPFPGKFDDCDKICKDTFKNNSFGGAFFKFLYAPEEVLGKGVVTGLECNLFKDLPHRRVLEYSLAWDRTEKQKISLAMDDEFGVKAFIKDVMFDGFARTSASYENRSDTAHKIKAGVDLHFPTACASLDAEASSEESLKVKASYMHSITRNIALGASILDLSQLVKDPLSNVCLSGRYTQRYRATGTDVCVLKLIPRSFLSVNYTKQYTPKISISSDFMYALNSTKAFSGIKLQPGSMLTSLGCSYKFSVFNFQGSLNSVGDVRSHLEYKQNDIVMLRTSGEYNQFTGDSACGVGVVIG